MVQFRKYCFGTDNKVLSKTSRVSLVSIFVPIIRASDDKTPRRLIMPAIDVVVVWGETKFQLLAVLCMHTEL
jgi:hypothetical protein